MGDAPRAYLAGPMTGRPDYNRVGFTDAAQWVHAQGWMPVSPHDTDPSHDGPCPDGERHKGHPNACWYAAGLRMLTTCDLIVLLPEWETSTGARLELAEARRRGIPEVSMPAMGVAIGAHCTACDRPALPGRDCCADEACQKYALELDVAFGRRADAGLFVEGEDRSGQTFTVYGVMPRKDALISWTCPITHEQEPEVLAWLRGPRVLGALRALWAPLLDEAVVTP